LAVAALNKIVHRNNRRTKDVVITAEHPKAYMSQLAWFGNTVFETDVC